MFRSPLAQDPYNHLNGQTYLDQLEEMDVKMKSQYWTPSDRFILCMWTCNVANWPDWLDFVHYSEVNQSGASVFIYGNLKLSDKMMEWQFSLNISYLKTRGVS